MGFLAESHDGCLAGFFFCLDLIDTCEVECGASGLHSGLESVFVWTELFNGAGRASLPPCSTEAMEVEATHLVWALTFDSELLRILECRLETLLVAGRLVVAANLHRVSPDLWMAMGVLRLEALEPEREEVPTISQAVEALFGTVGFCIGLALVPFPLESCCNLVEFAKSTGFDCSVLLWKRGKCVLLAEADTLIMVGKFEVSLSTATDSFTEEHCTSVSSLISIFTTFEEKHLYDAENLSHSGTGTSY